MDDSICNMILTEAQATAVHGLRVFVMVNNFSSTPLCPMGTVAEGTPNFTEVVDVRGMWR